MTRKNRSRPAPQQGKQLTAPTPAPEPAAGPETPPVEPAMQPVDATTAAIVGELAALDAPSTEPAVAQPDPAAVPPAETSAPEPAEVVVAEVLETPRLSPEPTLHELNQRAWAIDDEHAAKRLAAQEKINEVAKPLLAGVQRGRVNPRRAQKPLRGLVKG